MVAKGQPGQSNRDIKYACTRCGEEVGRDHLTVRRVVFNAIGLGGKQLRSRTTHWLCEPCRDADSAWNAKPFQASPGFADVEESFYDKLVGTLAREGFLEK